MDDVEKYVDLPVLAVIPQGIKMLPNAGDNTADAEGPESSGRMSILTAKS